MIEHIPALVEAGIDSLKIEGRMKSVFYVASVVKAYRQALDAYFENPEEYKFNPKWLEYLLMPSHRTYYTGFYFEEENKQVYDSSAYEKSYDVIGIVKDFDKENMIVTIEQKNKVLNGDTVEVLKVVNDNVKIKLEDMRNSKGEAIESAPAAKMIFTAKVTEELEENDILIKFKGDK